MDGEEGDVGMDEGGRDGGRVGSWLDLLSPIMEYIVNILLEHAQLTYTETDINETHKIANPRHNLTKM